MSWVCLFLALYKVPKFGLVGVSSVFLHLELDVRDVSVGKSRVVGQQW